MSIEENSSPGFRLEISCAAHGVYRGAPSRIRPEAMAKKEVSDRQKHMENRTVRANEK